MKTMSMPEWLIGHRYWCKEIARCGCHLWSKFVAHRRAPSHLMCMILSLFRTSMVGPVFTFNACGSGKHEISASHVCIIPADSNFVLQASPCGAVPLAAVPCAATTDHSMAAIWLCCISSCVYAFVSELLLPSRERKKWKHLRASMNALNEQSTEMPKCCIVKSNECSLLDLQEWTHCAYSKNLGQYSWQYPSGAEHFVKHGQTTMSIMYPTYQIGHCRRSGSLQW